MNNINGFLHTLKNTLTKNQGEQGVLCDVFLKHGIVLKRSDFSFQGTTLRVKANPYMRSEILLRKKAILHDIQKEKLQKEIQDIQ